MRFYISRSAPTSAGLQVIQEIPNYPLCYLEGRNGIGKSVSARLLELATGGQPYAALPHAWRTLKDQLGHTTITVSDLPGGHELVFDINPQTWPDDPVRDLGDEFARVSIDGTATTIADTHALLRVRRISGDETLMQTLARDLEERSVLADAVQRHWARPMAEEWEHQLTRLTDLIGGVSRSALLDAWAGRVNAAAAAEDAQAQAAATTAIVNVAMEATAAADGLAQRRRDLPPLVAELTATSDILAEAGATLDEANARVEQAAVALAGTSSLRAEVTRWERLQGYRQRALQKEKIKERQLLGALGLDVRPDDARLFRMIRSAEKAIADALARRDQIDLVEPRLKLAREIERPLATASPRLGEEVIARTVPPATVDELLAGVRKLRDELDGRPRPDELARLERDADVAQRRLDLLRALQSQARVTDRKQQKVAEAERELAALFADLDESSRSAYEEAQRAAEDARAAVINAELRTRELRKQIAELLDIAPRASAAAAAADQAAVEEDEDEQAAADEQAPIDTLYPDVDEAFATEKAAAADAAAGVALGRLDIAALTAAESASDAVELTALRAAAVGSPVDPLSEAALHQLRLLHEAMTRVNAAATARREDAERSAEIVVEADRRVATLRAAISHAWACLTPGAPPEWAQWAAAAMPLLTATAHTGPLTVHGGEPDTAELAAADALEGFAAIAQAQIAAAFEVADRLAILSGYLKSVAAYIAPRVRDAGPTRPGDFQRTVKDALRGWVENALAESLATPELLRQLFGGAERIRVGLDDLTLTWRPAIGGVRKRPLEAFSSGEQVFAYTRANLMRLRRERRPGQSVVVILDEFGAFVARDRLGQLMHFVEHEALDVTDQVVVMLPLSRAYPKPVGKSIDDAAGAATPDDSGPELPDTPDERGRQIDDRGYFAVRFTTDSARLA